jgi:pyruvate/2-oxoglutarate dehydrogenase complex dihydrolipoamide dehydrogenase (E3) component/uncharacterized membrane protein YdjX (TVP38/TMEM64 family)
VRDRKKLILLLVLAAAIAAFFMFDLQSYLTLASLKARQADFAMLYQRHPWSTAGAFFLIYVAVTAISLPGAAILTLVAGALFGLLAGTVIVSFASSLGATLAFLVSRYLLRDSVQRRFGTRLRNVNAGIRRDGAFYLFTLRLVPVFPFFLINLLMGLTPMPARTFYWVSQLGMFAGTIVYVNAGTQLARIESTAGLLSPQLLGAFVLLGLFPWAARFLVARVQAWRVYRPWASRRPRRFDRNLIVIGAGSAGLVTAYIAAAVKATVTLVEKHRMGGDCLNTGCVPSKALIRSARIAHEARHAGDYGLVVAPPQVEFGSVMRRVHEVIGKIAPHDSVARYTELGVDCREGEAKLLSPWEVEIRHGGGTDLLTARNIVIATGGKPLVPPIPGLDDVGYLTSDTLWGIDVCPARLLVLGGGPIGCELAQAFARLGSAVTQVEMLPRLLIREDEEASRLVTESLEADGVRVLLEHKAVRFSVEAGDKVVYLEYQGATQRLAFDAVLVAVGRRGNTEGLNLGAIGVETNTDGTVRTDEYLRTRFPNIFACGDVAGPYQFTHTAAHQAWYAAVNALFGSFKRFKADYSVIPRATFTDPEVARVGMNEAEAKAQGIAVEVTRYGLDDLDRAIADGSDRGYVRVLTAPGSDRILGVTIVGEHAGDLIAEYVLAMRHGIGLNKILGTIHIYPTLAEANKYAAGAWKRAHAPAGVLRWLERLHRWHRG